MAPRFRQVKFSKPLTAIPQSTPSQSDKSSTWKALQALLPVEVDQQAPPTETEAQILRAFGRHPDSLLEVPSLGSLPSPFEYHLSFNQDVSYITQPRLSVTKLLTSAWCELREYYTVFGGLPRMPPLTRMKSGSEYHAKLENEEHFQIDPALLDEMVGGLLLGVPPDEREGLQATTKEYKMANDWLEHNIKRCLQLSVTKLARELYLHAFLDLENGRFATEPGALHKTVLVNGIADIIQIVPSLGTSDAPSDSYSPGIMDLNEEISYAARNLAALAKDHILVMGDVKTRSWSTLPAQQLVIDAAKTQCMYYAQMFHNITQSEAFAYESYLENASRRQLQIDAPISIAFTIKLLVAHFKTLVVDCLRLARGEPIGLKQYDEKTVLCAPYSLSSLLPEEEFRELLMAFYGEDPEIMELNLAPLFQPWQKPLTFRYVAARAAQVASSFNKLHPGKVEVEYHNVKLERMFEKKVAPFDLVALQRSISEAALLWSGQRLPTNTKDFSKCHYCDFKKRCAAINEKRDSSILQKIYELQGS